MFQDHALFPHRDVAGNVGFGLRMAHTPRAESAHRIDEVLELVGLSGFAARSVDNLSGGERQRVALARALAPRPSLLLLDEPLGALARALRDRLLDDLADVLRSSGATVVHVTHDQGEAFATGERVVVMRSGRIAQVGAPDELWPRPVDAGVARIVGPAGVVPVEIVGGRVRSPWGALDGVSIASTVDGDAVLILRPDDVEVEAGSTGVPGAIPARVVARSFRGDQVLLRVALVVGEGSEVEVPVVEGAASDLVTGSEVTLRLIPGRGSVVAPG
jgi:thiamine transport system ATP-binding protein